MIDDLWFKTYDLRFTIYDLWFTIYDYDYDYSFIPENTGLYQ